MKIIFIVPEIVISGGMRLIFEYAGRLTDRGHEVTLYTPMIPFNPYKGKTSFPFFKYAVKYFIRCLTGNSRAFENVFDKKFEIKYVPVIKNIFIPDADAIIATAWTTSYYVSNLKEAKGKKYYLIQDYEIWNSNEKYADESYTLKLNRIVISTYLKNLLKEKFGVDSTLVLNGINFNRFYNDNKVFHKPCRILFMDHQLGNKNVECAVEIVTKLYKEFPELIIRAFGAHKHHLMPDFVEFHENLSDEDVRNLYCDSDIFIFPSKYEGFGGPPAEAMACKCAVVGNAVAALPEYSKHMESAILCNPDNPDEIYRGILYLLNNGEELKRISLNGYEYVRKILDFERAVSEFENILMN